MHLFVTGADFDEFTVFFVCVVAMLSSVVINLHIYHICYYMQSVKMKKVLREMQTLCARCSKAEPNLISWRWSLPSPTDPVW